MLETSTLEAETWSGMLDSRAYYYASVAANYILLNLVWLLACIPIVTIVPSTLALYCVVRDWAYGRDDAAVVPFIRHFLANFTQSFGIGVLWITVGATVVVNMVIVGQMDGAMQVLLASSTLFVASVYAISSVFMFPLMAGYNLRWHEILKYSFVLGFGRLLTSVQCLLISAALAFLAYSTIIPMLFVGSLTAFLTFRLCDRQLSAIESSKNGQ